MGGDPYPDPESFLVPLEVRQPPPARVQRSVIAAAITLLFIAVGIGVLANSPAGSDMGASSPADWTKPEARESGGETVDTLLRRVGIDESEFAPECVRTAVCFFAVADH